jgi:hypothetical protein
MLFFRFRFTNQLNLSFGMSDSSVPDQFGDFEVELSMRNSESDLKVNDDGSYSVLKVLEPDTWYNAWVLIDNALDACTIYLNAVPEGSAEESDLLDSEGQTVFVFRDGSARNLSTFFVKTGGGNSTNSGPFYIDDIYVENTPALNLWNPTGPSVSEPCLCDFEPNGRVDEEDLGVVVWDFGRMDCFGDCPADITLDIDMDGLDLATFAAELGRTDCPQ